MSQLWWKGSSSTCIHPGGNVLKGWELIRSFWEAIFKNTDYLEIDKEISYLKFLGYDLSDETWTSSLLNFFRLSTRNCVAKKRE